MISINSIFSACKRKLHSAHASIISFLYQYQFGRTILAKNNCALLRIASADTLNNISYNLPGWAQVLVKSNPYFWLAFYGHDLYNKPDRGLSILAANDYELTKLIDAETLNANVKRTERYPHQPDVPLACYFSEFKVGQDILAARDYALVKLINAETVNKILIVLNLTSRNKSGSHILFAHNKLLLNMLSSEALGTMINDEPLAFILQGYFGDAIFAENNYALMKKIDPQLVQRVCTNGHWRGFSLAFFFSTSQLGREILIKNNYTASLNQYTLNRRMTLSEYDHESIVFHFAGCEEGQQALADNAYYLATKISDTILDIAPLRYNRETTRSRLNATPLGRQILKVQEMTPKFARFVPLFFAQSKNKDQPQRYPNAPCKKLPHELLRYTTKFLFAG